MKGLSTVWRDAIRDSGLSRTDKLVCLLLSTYMNGQAETFVSKEKIAEKAGMSIRGVDNAILRIGEAGYPVVQRSKGRRPNHYFGVSPNPELWDGVKTDSTPNRGTLNPERGSHQP